MTTLRSRLIRLAYSDPALQPHLLPLLREAAVPKTAPQSVFEITLKGSYRDFKTDPSAPVQTLNLLPQSLGWMRRVYSNASEAKKGVAQIVTSLRDEWERGLGQGHRGAFSLPPRAVGGGATPPTPVVPDAYREATLTVEKITARGDRVLVNRWRWERGGSWVG